MFTKGRFRKLAPVQHTTCPHLFPDLAYFSGSNEVHVTNSITNSISEVTPLVNPSRLIAEENRPTLNPNKIWFIMFLPLVPLPQAAQIVPFTLIFLMKNNNPLSQTQATIPLTISTTPMNLELMLKSWSEMSLQGHTQNQQIMAGYVSMEITIQNPSYLAQQATQLLH